LSNTTTQPETEIKGFTLKDQRKLGVCILAAGVIIVFRALIKKILSIMSKVNTCNIFEVFIDGNYIKTQIIANREISSN
jgi:hypothetical protein